VTIHIRRRPYIPAHVMMVDTIGASRNIAKASSFLKPRTHQPLTHSTIREHAWWIAASSRCAGQLEGNEAACLSTSIWSTLQPFPSTSTERRAPLSGSSHSYSPNSLLPIPTTMARGLKAPIRYFRSGRNLREWT